MLKFLLFIFIIATVSSVFGSDRLPVPESTGKYEPDAVIFDPATGEKLVSNQILVVFREKVDRKTQETILASIEGHIIGGMPGLDVYQVRFENRQFSFDKFQTVFTQLQNNDDVLLVMPRKISVEARSETNQIANFASYKRSGALQLQKMSGKNSGNGPDNYEAVIDNHQSGLRACLTRKSKIFTNFHGIVIFEIDVAQNGEVTAARITDSSFKNRRLLSCLLNKVRNWRDFPRHSTGANVQLRFSFDF